MGEETQYFYEFGRFRVDPRRRLLLHDEQPVPLQPKAFDVLLVLLQRGDSVVLKDDLLKSAWPNVVVEESNLAQTIFVLRKALESSGGRRSIVTVPGRGYQFTENVRRIPQQDDIEVREHSTTRVVISEVSGPRAAWQTATWAALATATLVGATWYAISHRPPKLTVKDTIVVAEFANSTGDAQFDGTLRLALIAQLEQSPYLNLLPEQRAVQTLTLMGKAKEERLTRQVAREVCQRTASAAVLDGAISQVGTHYLLTVRAENCATGELLSSIQAEAGDKNAILDALTKTATVTRGQLGESLASVKQYDLPAENVTTPSLEALRAYALAHQAQLATRAADSVPLYEHAIDLDPQFAMAYLGMGISQFNLGEASLAADNVKRAYDVREHVSERERLGIELIYATVVTRNFNAALQASKTCANIYPRDARIMSNLGLIYTYRGDYTHALDAARDALALNPGAAQNFFNLVVAYLHLNRLEDALASLQQAKIQALDASFVHQTLYTVAFLRGDDAGMEREAAQVAANDGSEDSFLFNESDTAAYGGHFVVARQLTQRAVDAAVSNGQKETAAEYTAAAALREALVGNLPAALSQARQAMTLSTGRNVVAIAAISLALASDGDDAIHLGDDLHRRFAEDTVLQHNLLPTLRAALALQRKDPDSAIMALADTQPYELGQTAQSMPFVLFPVYFRAEAYRTNGHSAAAIAEFEKILGHPGLVQNELIGSLAHLGMARAYELSGDTRNAQAAYQDFFSLWKNADQNLPLIRQAREEYANKQMDRP